MIHGLIIRGTTPTHDFELPYPMDLVDDIRVIYGQGGKPLFTKTKNDCDITEGKISLDLIQEETYLFNPRKTLEIEIKLKLKDGKVVRSEEPIVLRVIDTMGDEVFD